MGRALVVLVAAAIVLAIAWWVADLPGTVSAQVGATTITASTPAAILCLAVVFLLVHAVLRLLGGLIGLPSGVARWRTERRRRFGDIAVTRALVALAAGDSADARQEASRARRLLGETPQTLLLTAEAGRLAGRSSEEEEAFRKLTERPDGAFLGLRGLLRQAVARQDWSEATALARRAEAVHPGAAWLRAERAQLAIRTGAWSDALALADADASKAALATAAAEAEADPAHAMRLARQAWEEDPSLVPAALAYARRLRETGRDRRAHDVIRRTWAANPHPDLAVFALAATTDTLGRVQEAKRLAQENPEHGESHLLLARASLDAGLTGEARHQIEAAQKAGLNQRRVWMLLADIEEAERGDTDEGRAAQRDALRHAATAAPDPVWRCANCGTAQPHWTPACPNCGAVGQERYGG